MTRTSRALWMPAMLVTAALVSACSLATVTETTVPSGTQPPVVIEASKLITWEIGEGVSGVLVVQQLHNIGQNWVQIAPRDSDYQIKSPNGNVVAANDFRHSYPTYLAPGEVGYLIDQFVEGAVPIENITTLTVFPRFRDLTERPSRRLDTTNVTLRSDDLPGGLYFTGEAENVGEEDVATAHVGAVFLDDAGEIIGATTTDMLQHVGVGESKAFETRPSNPLTEDDFATFLIFASPTL